jgi:hypothetical protein
MRLAGGVVLVAILAASPAARLSAQDTTIATRRDSVPRRDALRPDTSHLMRPGAALWRSLVLPGWGQSATGRHTVGAILLTWEGVTAMMTLKAQQEADYMKQTGSSNLKAKRQEVQDWLVLWVFNHLFAGADAFVSAHLQDFPKDLQLRAVPGGVGLALPLPRP